ncbi:MAG: beta-propeller domain-containing protein, partial [Nocardioides sp.]|nr:beta-propeller domain-containing protein [Nocardioides sp.]
MNDLERLWDDLPVGPAPVADILRDGRSAGPRPRRTRPPMRPLTWGAVLGGFAAAFVAGTLVDRPLSDAPPAGPDGDRVVVTPGDALTPAAFHGDLQPAESCAELRRSYVERALELVGPYGWELYYPQFGRDRMLLSQANAPVPTAGRIVATKANYRGPQTTHQLSSETGTNVQEAGVDEPDTVKTDGERLLRLKDSVLTTYDVTGDQVAELGALDLGDLRNGEILLAGDTVVAIGNPGRRLGATRVLTVDISDPASPALVETVDYDSALLTARQHGGDVRLVLQAGLPRLDFVEPGPRRDGPLRQRLRDAREANRQVVRESTLADWVPGVVREDGGSEQLVDCDRMAIPRADLALDTVAVVGFSAESPSELDAFGLAGAAPMVYESPGHLYLASQADSFSFGFGIVARKTGGSDGVTHVFDFALDGAGASYVGSGEVEGSLADRWSMDEHDGVLRLAVGPTSETGNFNSIVTLRAEGDQLVEIGRLDQLGVNEQVESVRWFRGLAILVTYRQVDPLYAVDLTDQTAPRLAGELKIPGFSEYLHPLGKHWMVGMGQGRGDDRRGWGAQVSLFNVSDLARPQRLDVLEYAAGTDARAGDDPRQFTWLGQERVALTV